MKNISKTLLLFSGIFFNNSCIDQESVGHHNTYPTWKTISKIVNKDHQLVVNVGDFFDFDKVNKELRDKGDDVLFPITIDVGGHKVRKRYLEIIKERLLDSTLVVSASDHYNKVYPIGELPLDAIKVPLMVLKSSRPLPKAPWINSNILDITTGEPTHFKKTVLEKLIRPKSQVLAVNDSSLLKNIVDHNLTGLYFQDGVTTLLKNKSSLMTILLFHGDTKCEGGVISNIVSFDKAKDMDLTCPPNDPLSQMVKRLPTPESISLIISSQDRVGSGFIDGIPVLFSHESNAYLHPILIHKKKRKKSFFLPPIKMCHDFFKATKDCHYRLGNNSENKKRLASLKKK